MILLVSTRYYWHTGGAEQESINQAAEAKQVLP
jgi:hypothetical protein